jgi:Rap1a immunity proteins
MRMGLWLAAAMLPAVLAATAPAWADLTEDAFQLRSTGDLVDLCTAPQTDKLYTAAANFCHGFAVGVVRTLQDEEAASRNRRKMFCMPDPMPSRTDAISSFAAWVKADPQRMSMKAEDGVVAFLMDNYKCPARH